jgi:peptidoglycan/xylan/chitin deacetylase (PgdA/CDA1 family)
MIHQSLGKRDALAVWAGRLGVTALLGALPKQNLLLVLNYHRIGDPEKTPYDPGVFSATPDDLDQQIALLKKHTRVVTLEEVIAIAENQTPLQGPCSLITFDDGYRDNYDLAFPILRSHGVQGVFFLPTSYIGTGKLPWWDAIAYILKHSAHRQFVLTYPSRAEFDLAKEPLEGVLRRILAIYKMPGVRGEPFIADLERACHAKRPQDEAERCFMSWKEAAEMVQAGMSFGAHTHEHELLAKLPVGQQYTEVVKSRQIIEERLGAPVHALAYPVGSRTSFSADTISVLKRANYRAAFSFYGGMNVPSAIDRFDIRRLGVVFDGRQSSVP